MRYLDIGHVGKRTLWTMKWGDEDVEYIETTGTHIPLIEPEYERSMLGAFKAKGRIDHRKKVISILGVYKEDRADAAKILKMDYPGYRIVQFTLAGNVAPNPHNQPTLYDLIPKVDIPKMKFGIWNVDTFTVDKKHAKRFNKGQWEQGVPDRGIVPGTYTHLTFTDEKGNNHVMMSDVPAEAKDHLPAVLHNEPGMTWIVNGLGIGMVVNALLEGGAAHVTVVENDEDIVDHIAPIYEDKWGDQLTVVLADAFSLKLPKGMKWDAAWHDIWPTISDENLPQMTKLKRKYARRVKWQGAWAQKMCRDMRSGKLYRCSLDIPMWVYPDEMQEHFARVVERKALDIEEYL